MLQLVEFDMSLRGMIWVMVIVMVAFAVVELVVERRLHLSRHSLPVDIFGSVAATVAVGIPTGWLCWWFGMPVFWAVLILIVTWTVLSALDIHFRLRRRRSLSA